MAEKKVLDYDKDDLDTEIILSKLSGKDRPDKPDKVDFWGRMLVGLVVIGMVSFLIGGALTHSHSQTLFGWFVSIYIAIFVTLLLIILYNFDRAQKEMMPIYLRQMGLERKALLDPHVKSLLKMLEKDLLTTDFNLLEERSENYRKLKALLNDSNAIADKAYIDKVKQYSEALMEDAKKIKKEAREELILD